MISSVWKLISLFLALGAFLCVGAYTLNSGEDLMWAVLKAVSVFFVSWILLGQLGNMLLTVLERQEEISNASDANADSVKRKG